MPSQPEVAGGPKIRSREDVLHALVAQLAALARGTTTSLRAAEVRRAAAHALDLFEQAELGSAGAAELSAALERVEAVLKGQRH